jgi:hypothetical protein
LDSKYAKTGIVTLEFMHSKNLKKMKKEEETTDNP